MATSTMTLSEYAQMIADLAEDWEGEEPAVLIGDVVGDLSVRPKDGYTKHGNVAYAQELFDDDGTWALGKETDRRWYGTLLIDREHLSEEARTNLEEIDWEPAAAGGGA